MVFGVRYRALIPIWSSRLSSRRLDPGASVQPNRAWLPVWSRARSLAEMYWERLSADERLSEEFRQLCVQSIEALRALSLFHA
jgi:hypothetical protein